MTLRSTIRNALLSGGLKPRTIRGGQLKGMRFGLDLRKSTQPWMGRYERCLQNWLVSHVPAGGVCLDIGAADGYFALLMAKLAGPTGSVWAFEPSAVAAEIRPNFELNPRVPLAKLEVFESF